MKINYTPQNKKIVYFIFSYIIYRELCIRNRGIVFVDEKEFNLNLNIVKN